MVEHVGLGADHRQCSAMARKLLLHVDATRFVPLEMEVWDGEGLHATWTFSDYVSVGGCLAPRLVVWRIAKRKETFGHTWEFRFRFQTWSGNQNMSELRWYRRDSYAVEKLFRHIHQRADL